MSDILNAPSRTPLSRFIISSLLLIISPTDVSRVVLELMDIIHCQSSTEWNLIFQAIDLWCSTSEPSVDCNCSCRYNCQTDPKLVTLRIARAGQSTNRWGHVKEFNQQIKTENLAGYLISLIYYLESTFGDAAWHLYLMY